MPAKFKQIKTRDGQTFAVGELFSENPLEGKITEILLEKVRQSVPRRRWLLWHVMVEEAVPMYNILFEILGRNIPAGSLGMVRIPARDVDSARPV